MTGEEGYATACTPARSWCARCRTARDYTGERQISPGGVVRVRGKCPVCRQRLRTIIGLI